MCDFHVENEILMKGLSEIRPYEKNPRKNDKTVELLAKIIPVVGFNVPIVIDRNNVIVKGHARYQAAKKLGMKEVPCIISHASPEAIKADRIADNKISEFSEWLQEGLAHELDMLDLDLGFDLSELGFAKVDYGDIPFVEDFEAEGDKNETPMSAEEKQKMYEEFLARYEKEYTAKVQMSTQSDIESAKAKQANTPSPQKEYGQCVCPKCGNVMYYDKNILYCKGSAIRR